MTGWVFPVRLLHSLPFAGFQRRTIRLSIRTVGEYLRRWGFTPQKPVRKAYKQDPKAVAEWLERTYPGIEKRAAKEGGEIHWGDETGVRSTCQHSRGAAMPVRARRRSRSCPGAGSAST